MEKEENKRLRFMKRKRGFTLIELIVVMAILAVLVLLAAPRFIGQTKEAQFTKHINNAKVLEDAAERYYIDHGAWPRGDDDAVYTPEEVSAYADKIYDITGEELVLEEGKYWDIDYSALDAYAKLPDESERANYVLRNPVGTVYYLEGLTEVGELRLTEYRSPLPDGADSQPHVPEQPEAPEEWQIPDSYVLATDADFSGTANGLFRYIGGDKYVIIPDVIKGVPVTSYGYMFQGTAVEGVASTNKNVTNMGWMFYQHAAETLDLRGLDTSGATNMSWMFHLSKADVLDVSHFDTSRVATMYSMFNQSAVKTLDLRNFDTSNVTTMFGMFSSASATEIDVTSFDTSKVTDMGWMFQGTKVTTLDLGFFNLGRLTESSMMFTNAIVKSGVARTTKDANIFNQTTTARFTIPEQPVRYTLATDADFTGTSNGNFRYNGTSHYVIMPDTIKGVNVTSYRNMFEYSDVRGVVSTNPNVTDMTNMFYQSQSPSLDLSRLDTSGATNMSYMFHLSKATTVDVSHFDTSRVATMYNMFNQSAVKTLDLRNFDTSNVTTMFGMFSSASATKIDVTSFDTSKVTDMGWMFQGTKPLTLDLSSFNLGRVTERGTMFSNAAVTSGKARTTKEANMFNQTTNARFTIEEQPVRYTLATDADFTGTSNGNFRYNGTSHYVIMPDTIKGVNVTSYRNMFEYSDVRGVVSTNPNVTDMTNMFYQSQSPSLDLSRLDTSGATNMSYMFHLSKATTVDVSTFDTANVTDMRYMFYGSQVTALDLRNFNTANVTDMRSMFEGSKATTLDLSSFDLRSVVMGTASATSKNGNMFFGTAARTGYARTTADATKLNDFYAYRPTGLTFIVKP